MTYNDQIEAVARGICEELGLAPERILSHDYGANFTPAEQAYRGETTPENCFRSPRWQLYRGQAALAIATKAALARLEAE